MSIDLIFAILFYLILYLIFLKYRSKFEIQNKFFVLYKTKIGLKLMDRLSKYSKTLKVLSFISIFLSFVGMIFIFYILLKGTYNLIAIPESQPMLAPVLPGVAVPGLPVLSFWHWIISILIIAAIHEFCHGVYARLNKIKIKSSGFAFLGPILAAFVEPDEKQMEKKSKYAQLSVLSAGPFSNILLGFLVLVLVIFILSPIASSMTEYSGMEIITINKSLPISNTTLKEGDIILKINNETINTRTDFTNNLDKYSPHDIIYVTTMNSTIPVELGENSQNSSKPLLGVSTSEHNIGIKKEIKEKYLFLPDVFFWFFKLLFWIYLISVGVGLFNLLPLGPVDGGRMFYVASLYVIKDKLKAKKIYNYITLICLTLIFINLLPYIIKLISFILTPIFILF